MFRIGVIGFIVRPGVRGWEGGGLNESQRRVGRDKGRYIYISNKKIVNECGSEWIKKENGMG